MFSILSFYLVESFLVRLFILIHDSPARRAARTSAARGVKHIQWGNFSFPPTKGSLTWGTTLYFHSLLISRPVRSQDVFFLARWPRARSSTQRTTRLLSNFIFNAPDITTLTSGNNSAQTWHSSIATFVFVLGSRYDPKIPPFLRFFRLTTLPRTSFPRYPFFPHFLFTIFSTPCSSCVFSPREILRSWYRTFFQGSRVQELSLKINGEFFSAVSVTQRKLWTK